MGGATGTATNFVITVKRTQVAGEHHLRILLPTGYAANPAQRYPVFYFLHGASDDPANPNLAYPALTAATSMITVIPDGGLRLVHRLARPEHRRGRAELGDLPRQR